MSTSRRTLRERMQGQRQSKNIEDRRGVKVPIDDESDKYPPIYQFPQPMSEDINDPIGTEYELQTHVPIYKAREDLVTEQKAMRKPPYDRARIGEIKPSRRKRKVL